MRLSELAEIIGAKVVYPEGGSSEVDTAITAVAPIEVAKEGEVTFVSNPEYAKYVAQTHASAVIVKELHESCKIPMLLHDNPYFAFAKTAHLFYRPHRGPHGVSEHAFIASDATLGDDVTIYPHAFIGSRAKLGNQVVVMPGVSIGDDVEIGDNTILYSNVVIYHDCKIGDHCIIHSGTVIGADGFGYAVGEGEIVKIPQVGNVVIGDHVEMGAMCSIDRAAMGSTVIKSGTKLDNKVQVGHNVEVGENCMLSAFSGLAGSCKLGDWVIMGGHSGVNGHTEVCSGARIGAMTGVVKSIEEPGEYIGFPAIKARDWRRKQVYLKKITQHEERLKALEDKL